MFLATLIQHYRVSTDDITANIIVKVIYNAYYVLEVCLFMCLREFPIPFKGFSLNFFMAGFQVCVTVVDLFID